MYMPAGVSGVRVWKKAGHKNHYKKTDIAGRGRDRDESPLQECKTPVRGKDEVEYERLCTETI